MDTSTLSPRQTFRQLVAEIAAKAKAKLPEAVNGRIESAVKLVLSHDVTVLDDGSIEVGSSSDPLKTYRLEGTSCTCQDFAYGKAPEGWCQHRIAAGIAKRVGELLPVVPEIPVEAWPDHATEEAPALPVETAPAPASPAVLPEAMFSVTLKGLLGGQDAMLTVRGQSAQAFRANLQAVRETLADARGLLDPVQGPVSPPASPQGQDGTPLCKYHGAMKASTKAPGTFYCTRKLADGSYCPSRFPEH